MKQLFRKLVPSRFARKQRIRTTRNIQESFRRSLQLESLEARRVLTVISEVHVSPLFGDDQTEQYVEFRGEPNSTIAEGTYFVTVEGWGSVPGGPGYIHSSIDLSGLTFGSNGFLVIAQLGTPYSIDPDATALVSDSEGFSGLPDGRWSDATDLSDRFAFIFNSASFLLIQSDSAPVPAEDIDADDDGTLDGDYAEWEIIDGVGLHNSAASASRSYGKIVFSQEANTARPSGSTFVRTEGLDYVARIGASSTWEAEEWVAGVTQNEDTDALDEYRFTFGIFGDPVPEVYAGRYLNHLGTHNFNGAIYGSARYDTNGNDRPDQSDDPIPGGFVLADQNGNGVRDTVETNSDLGSLDDDTELTNRYPNATLTAVGDDNLNIGFKVRKQSTPVGNNNDFPVFASEGIPWFSDSTRMKITFYEPANSVSITAIAAESLRVSYGRMEAYDSAGNLLEFDQSRPLVGAQTERIGIQRTENEIKYVVIYTNDRESDSSPFGKFTALTYGYSEFLTEIDADGNYGIDQLPAGNYRFLSGGIDGTNYFPATGIYTLSVSETESLLGADYGYRENVAPTILTETLEVPENPTLGQVVGVVEATDPDIGQNLRWEFLGDASPFRIQPETGAVVVATEDPWDFESSSPISIEVRVTDSSLVPKSATQLITIVPVDINEAPEVENQSFAIAEDALEDAIVGTVVASDEDSGLNGELFFEIDDVSIAEIFSIDERSGEIRLSDPSSIDYESQRFWLLPIVVSDGGNPNLATSATIRVNINDANDAPVITSAEFEIEEESAIGTVVGEIEVTDPDDGQQVMLEVIGGTGAAFFEINTNDQIVVLDSGFEWVQSPTILTLMVRATDDGSPVASDEKEIAIEITRKNQPPEIESLVFEIPEDSAGGNVLGVIQAIGPEPGQNVAIVLNTDLSGTPFLYNATSRELRVKSNPGFDFETRSEYALEFVATDDGGPSLSTTATVMIRILDANEAPSLVAKSFEIPENSPQGTVVGEIDAEDPDQNDTLTFTLEGDSTDTFEFESGTNRILVKDPTILNFEDTNAVAITVTVTDADGLTDTRDFVINISDVNEPPRLVGTVEDLELLAASSGEYSVPTDLFEDPEFSRLTYSISMSDGNSLPDWLVYDPDSNTLTAAPWNPQAGEHRLKVVATDTGGESGDVEFSVDVTFNATPWTNTATILDVDGNNLVRPLDALLVIHFINRNGSQSIPDDVDYRDAFLDVNGDQQVRPIDALLVIHHLNRQGVGGEGEASWDVREDFAAGSDLDNLIGFLAFESVNNSKKSR